ncbi:sulfatase family protein [Candidimonas nitroreducens]|uniref:Sulfatase n=1 Tax=Candidimonas nitroreducens TaxID=683354 RepID=A0A225MQ96_9BURK|nr:sulfatase-like hydrolase/transferase [Candidimonas nitroreducens]OWT63517.1 sulfatase [Candidimonas nitroreducens]
MQPNFLFIITDQHRADHLGCYGNPIVRTPNIDRIAARGWRSQRFYVSNPVCMPNRATLMTGRMPSVHKVRSNGIALPLQATTFVELLRAGGYATACSGKIHLQPMTGDVPILGRAAGTRKAPPQQLSDAWHALPGDGPYDQESIVKWRSDPGHDLTLPYYGFEEVHLTMMHADGAHGHYGRWLEQRHPGSDQLVGPENALPKGGISALQAWRTAVPEELYSTSYIKEQAIGFLQRHAAQEPHKPFFLQVSFNDPHHPFTPPGHYWDMYDPDQMPLPAAYRPNVGTLPPPLAHLIAERDEGRANRESWMLQAVSEQDVREAIALTYGSITMIDDAVGEVLRSLEALGLNHNTVVIFTSDHGDYMGDHQLMFKGPIHYDGLIRVPFIWSDPELDARGASSDALAGTVDIAATVLARAGLQPFQGMQGQDLMPVMLGKAQGRPAVLVEEDNQRSFMGFDRPVRLRTLVTDGWRLSVYRGVQWGELYDLRDDPLELHNLWDDPQSSDVKARLLHLLVQTMEEYADDSPLPTARA